jgi:hypothetical protein
VRWIDLGPLDFSCSTPVRVIDINTQLAGDVTSRLAEYTLDANRALVGASFSQTEFLRKVPAETLDQVARFPDQLRCAP